MNDQSTPIYYVADLFKFYDALNGGPLFGPEKAVKKLIQYDVCKNEIEGLQTIASLKLMPITKEQYEVLKRGKTAKKEPLNWEALYTDMQRLFPVYSRLSAKGERQIYFADDTNQVSLVYYKDDDSLINSLMYSSSVWKALKAYYQTSPLLEEHRKGLELRTFLIRIIKNYLLMDDSKLLTEQPKNFSWQPEELAFKKFNADAVAPGPTPTWDEFVQRLNYPNVFRAWVWALFEPTNNIRQTMWLTGAGNDGKSAVQKALREIFGTQHVYDCKKGDEGRIWFQDSVYGKGLVNYADCDNPHLLNQQAIKQLTGGDATSIEGKGVSAFSGEIYAKLFVSSNMPPKINPDIAAQISRLIRLKLQPIAEGAPKDEQFKARLVAESYAFLYQCREQYEKHINVGNDELMLPPELDEEIRNECAEEDYYITEDFIENCIEFDPKALCMPGELNKALKQFVVLDLHYDSGKPKFIHTKLEARLGIMGIRIQAIKEGQKKFSAFKGFKIKDEFANRMKTNK